MNQEYRDILRRNMCSPIVLAILLLASALVYVGEYRDAWFISVVIIVNSLIGIVQEVRAKRVLKKLELMSAPRARLLQADGSVIEVPYDELVVGDRIQLQAGDDVPADGQVQQAHGLEINESLLTGESAAVEKATGQPVWAATTVLAGTAQVTVTAVGVDTKAGGISQALQRYQPTLTPLQLAIQRAISGLTFGAIGISLLILVVYLLNGNQAVVILKTITSAAVAVVPEGLLLASSLLLAFGSLRLAQASVLPQKLSAIEALALLKVLCVDKTGTLTSDEVALERIEVFDDTAMDWVAAMVALLARETSGGNLTGQALLLKLDVPRQAVIQQVMAFSSQRKMAGIRAQLAGQQRTVVMGAPEFVAHLAPLSQSMRQQLDEWAGQGLRVLLLAEFTDQTTPLKALAPGSGRPVAAVILQNSLRPGVVDAVTFLQQQGVQLRVISGDNPRTVQHIATAAGISQADRVITGSELADLSPFAFRQAADEHTIFARVQPEQKQQLIKHFRRQGLFTGMVGDGVNDALALKQADVGVAMQAGAPASRRVADIILLNNAFTSLPLGMRLGNRVMQAIELIATLFFHKIIYSVVLLATTLLLGVVYPYAPRHVTFMNMFLVTMPTLMWTLFPPSPRHRINPVHFWRDTLWSVTPIAILTGATMGLVYWLLRALYPAQSSQVASMTVLVATFFGVYMVFLAGPMLGVVMDGAAKKARLLYVVAVVTVVTVCLGAPWLRQFFDFVLPDVSMLWPVGFMVAIAAVTQWRLAQQAGWRLMQQHGTVPSPSE